MNLIKTAVRELFQTNMSEYSNDFEGQAADADAPYRLKLSIDVRSAKNFKMAGNAFVKFSV